MIYQGELRVEAWQRQDGEDWLFAFMHGAGAKLDLPEREISLPLSRLYKDVRLPRG